MFFLVYSCPGWKEKEENIFLVLIVSMNSGRKKQLRIGRSVKAVSVLSVKV
jgi:hypothetical protein